MYHKYFKRIMAFLLIALITASVLVGCNNSVDETAGGNKAETPAPTEANSEDKTEDNSKSETPAPGTANAEMKELDVYFYELNMADAAVSTYNQRYIGESRINAKTFPDREKLKNTLNTELMAGEGPDVIIALDNLFDSLYKVVKSGAFCDLEPLIKQDKSFDMSIYNQAVLDSGIVDGKRYFIPLSYHMPVMWTLKSILEEYGIEDDENWTWDKFLEFLGRAGQTSEGDSRYIQIDRISLLTSMFLSSEIEYIDYEKKQTRFDSPEFIQMLETYKKLCEYCMPDNVALSYKSINDMYKENKILFQINHFGGSLSPSFIWSNNTTVKYNFDTSMVLYPFPAKNPGSNPCAITADIAAVNNNSRYKTEAFNFIKIMLEEETQIPTGMSLPIWGTPVNNEAYEKSLKQYEGEGGTVQKNVSDIGRVPGVKIHESLGKSARNIVHGIKKCLINDVAVMKFIEEGASKFVEGKVTAGQAAKEINSKVMLYLNE